MKNLLGSLYASANTSQRYAKTISEDGISTFGFSQANYTLHTKIMPAIKPKECFVLFRWKAMPDSLTSHPACHSLLQNSSWNREEWFTVLKIYSSHQLLISGLDVNSTTEKNAGKTVFFFFLIIFLLRPLFLMLPCCFQIPAPFWKLMTSTRATSLLLTSYSGNYGVKTVAVQTPSPWD